VLISVKVRRGYRHIEISQIYSSLISNGLFLGFFSFNKSNAGQFRVINYIFVFHKLNFFRTCIYLF